MLILKMRERERRGEKKRTDAIVLIKLQELGVVITAITKIGTTNHSTIF